MNKLFATIVLAAFALSSCIKEDDSYKERLPVLPGETIYNMTMTQNSIASQPANAGMRLALLVAEARFQNADDPATEITAEMLSSLTLENVTLRTRLFGTDSKIEAAEGGFKITYSESVQQADGFYLKGSVLVKTNGAEQLKDATSANPWQVVPQELKVIAYSQYGDKQTVNVESGSTTLYSDGNGQYVISLNSIRANIDEKSFYSDWSGTLYLSAEDDDLIYSKCKGKDFKVYSDSYNYPSGDSIYSYDGSQKLALSYQLTDGVFRGMTIIEGTQECSFVNRWEYDTAAYPSGDVRYVWSNNGNTIYRKIYYNNYVYPKD